MGKIDTTLATLRKAAEKSDSVCVAYSGGKDSMTVMDLCVRTFKRVEAFYMYFVPGLPSEEAKLAFCKERFGVTIRQMPHWASIRTLQSWGYVDPQPALGFLPDWMLQDCYDIMLKDTQCGYIAVGAKKSDSSWRRRFMKGTEHWETVINPIADWNKFDVLGYLNLHNLPVSAMRAANMSGIGADIRSIQFLHDSAPEDFKVLCDYFNLAGAAVAHGEFFGKADAK